MKKDLTRDTGLSGVRGGSFVDESLPLAVVMTETKWNESPRIRHQITRQLQRWSNVIFVEFFPTESGKVPRTEKISERILILRSGCLTCLPPSAVARIPFLMPLIHRRFAAELGDFLKDMTSGPKLLFNFVHTDFGVMKLPHFEDRTYVCFDEFPRMWREAKRPSALKYFLRSKLFQFYENRVARLADRCLAVHSPLREKLLKHNPNTHLFLQATELSNPGSEYVDRKSSGEHRIQVAYMGYLTYNQLIPWLKRVASESDMDLWLIGPKDHKFSCEGTLSGPRVHYTGPIEGRALMEKLASMDVLTMAYDPKIPEVSVQTASNKFFQYLASGRPVVISDMKHYLKMPKGVLYRASDVDEFISGIRSAHSEDCERLQALRQQIAAVNTWDKRGEQLHGYLKEALGDRIPDLV